jgi:hypothetical protein
MTEKQRFFQNEDLPLCVGKGRELLTADEFSRRSRFCTLVGPQIFGPKFFALVSPLATSSPRVTCTLPNHFVEKANWGMNISAITASKARRVVHFGEHKFQVDAGYVAARQISIGLATIIDEDCM